MNFTKQQLLTYANPSKININLSSHFMSAFGLADKFGTKYNLSSSEVFLKELQKFSSVDLSAFTYKEPMWVTSKETSVESLDKIDTIIPEVKEVVLEKPVEVLKPVNQVVEEPSKEAEPDWDWVDSLEDSPETRLELDEYASKFSVNLKRTMKVSNMAKKFKAEFN